jgi:choloylglycine hydrolase
LTAILPAGPQWSENTFRVNDVDFSPTGKVMKLDLGTNQKNTFSGNTVKDFKPAEPFKFLGL